MDLYRAQIPTGILYAPVQMSGSGTVVFGVTGERIVLISANLIASAAVNIKWQTSTGPTDLSGFAYLAQNGGYILPFNAGGWLQTAVGDSLLLNFGSAIAVGDCISYITV